MHSIEIIKVFILWLLNLISIYTYHHSVIVRTVNPQNKPFVADIIGNIEFALIPHPPNEVSQFRACGYVIVAGRHRHRYHFPCLRNEIYSGIELCYIR